MNLKDIKGYLWAKEVVEERFIANKWVKLECNKYIERLEKLQYDNDFKYYFDTKMCNKIYKLLKCMNYATGFYANKPIYDHMVGFQFMVIENIFCWLSKDLDEFGNKQRMIEEVYLELGRKSGKSFLAGLIEILIMLLSPKYAQHATAGKTRDISSLVKQAIIEIINSSPLIKKHFKITREKIECKINGCTQKALSGEANNINGLLLNSFIIDEVGNQENQDIIGALKLSQMSTVNRLSIYISTAYDLQVNAFKELCDYYKTVLNGSVEDNHTFGLLFELDKDDDYRDKNNWIKASPLQMSMNNGIEFLTNEYNKALEIPSKMKEFRVKILNEWLDGNGEETYIDINRWKECEVDSIDWNDKDIIVGVDLSKTTDLCSVSMAYRGDDGIFYCNSMGFLPTEDNPNRREKIDYKIMERNGYCIRTEGYSIDYGIVEEYIRNIESKYNCRIQSIVTDPYNCQNMMASLANDYEVILLTQTYTHLSSAVKTLREDVLNKKVRYEKNALLDWCMGNTIVIEGKGGGELIGKEKCYKNCKRIDMVATLINCMTQLIIEDNGTYSFEEAMNSLDKWNNM